MSQSGALAQHGRFLETRLKMQRMSRSFEALARGVLDECYTESSDRAAQLLRVRMDNYRFLSKSDGTYLDCIELAVEADNREFMSHPACQAQLEQEWCVALIKGGLTRVS